MLYRTAYFKIIFKFAILNCLCRLVIRIVECHILIYFEKRVADHCLCTKLLLSFRRKMPDGLKVEII